MIHLSAKVSHVEPELKAAARVNTCSASAQRNKNGFRAPLSNLRLAVSAQPNCGDF